MRDGTLMLPLGVFPDAPPARGLAKPTSYVSLGGGFSLVLEMGPVSLIITQGCPLRAAGHRMRVAAR